MLSRLPLSRRWSPPFWGGLLLVLGGALWGSPARAAESIVELVELSHENWDEYAPLGKEVDAIVGDFVLRNSQVVAVIARPAAGRNANMSIKAVGGCVIDLTQAGPKQNDQLGAYFPGGATRSFTSMDRVRVETVAVGEGPAPNGWPARGRQIVVEIAADPAPGKLELTTRYTLRADDVALQVDSIYRNPGSETLSEERVDAIRADRVFEFGSSREMQLFWANNDWFGQAYGVATPDHRIVRDKLLKLVRDGNSTLAVASGGTVTVRRWLIPAGSLLELQGVARKLQGESGVATEIEVRDSAGPVSHAQVTLLREGEEIGSGRTNREGRLAAAFPAGVFQVRVNAPQRPERVVSIEFKPGVNPRIDVEPCGFVRGAIVDGDGQPIPCKIAFYPAGDSKDPPRDKGGKIEPRLIRPYFGPDSAAFGVHNLFYSADGTTAHEGRATLELAPGRYDVLVSHGPEFDAETLAIEVRAGEVTELRATLRRTVRTPGWISGEFHSHSTPSGDNVASQLGRVLNLLAEHLEFAPCTEHNRIDTYDDELRLLKAARHMATCTGMELTGALLPINHQNAFPLVHRPRTQDGGGPAVDLNPVTQIERLALWDNRAPKLVQSNHPNLVQLFGDRDLDGTPDEGFRPMLGFMDVVEVHPIGDIFAGVPTEKSGPKAGQNAMFYWLQLLNLGYRIPAVVNTDAHYNFHGTGWLRNYVRSATDDPTQIQVADVVKECERGHVTMTNGPFLEVTGQAGERTALPGDDLPAVERRVRLRVRVQCPNWCDVNRVQIFVNGRPHPRWNYSRRSHPERFGAGVVKFDQTLELVLASDAHLVVAAAGEGLQLGPVMGPDEGRAMPVAVSNPIFVDVDGKGFEANRDTLDAPLPGAR